MDTLGNSQDLQQLAGSAAPDHQRWILAPCVQQGFPSAPPSLQAAAGEAKHNKETITRCLLGGAKKRGGQPLVPNVPAH